MNFKGYELLVIIALKILQFKPLRWAITIMIAFIMILISKIKGKKGLRDDLEKMKKICSPKAIINRMKFPCIVTIIGPRFSGRTTLARSVVRGLDSDVEVIAYDENFFLESGCKKVLIKEKDFPLFIREPPHVNHIICLTSSFSSGGLMAWKNSIYKIMLGSIPSDRKSQFLRIPFQKFPLPTENKYVFACFNTADFSLFFVRTKEDKFSFEIPTKFNCRKCSSLVQINHEWWNENYLTCQYSSLDKGAKNFDWLCLKCSLFRCLLCHKICPRRLNVFSDSTIFSTIDKSPRKSFYICFHCRKISGFNGWRKGMKSVNDEFTFSPRI